jgi:hypothetical protein
MRSVNNDLEVVLPQVMSRLPAVAPATAPGTPVSAARPFASGDVWFRGDSTAMVSDADGAFVVHAAECECNGEELNAAIRCIDSGRWPPEQDGIAGLIPYKHYRAIGCLPPPSP